MDVAVVDLEAAKVTSGFVGDVEVVHGFVHRGVELAGGDLVQVDVRKLDAIVAGVRLTDRSYVAELGEKHGDRRVDLAVLSAGG